MPTIEGKADGSGQRYGIVIARFNPSITQMLLDGALKGFTEHGVKEEDIDVAWVPGAFEIPVVAKKMAESRRYDGVICLGAVIRGETAHFDFVAAQSASGILQASLNSGIPVIFTVLTTNTEEQAIVRASPEGHNLGYNDAISTIKMANLLTTLT